MLLKFEAESQPDLMYAVAKLLGVRPANTEVV
jgi:hypothetical protein